MRKNLMFKLKFVIILKYSLIIRKTNNIKLQPQLFIITYYNL